MLRTILRLWSSLLVAAAILLLHSATASAQCAGADPNDWNDDRAALQACIDSSVNLYLEPGNPGYVVDSDKLRIRPPLRLLTSTGSGKARIIAGNSLLGPMLEFDPAINNYEISELIIDGRKEYRTHNLWACGSSLYAGHGTNVLAKGAYFRIHHLDIINALCGAGIEVTGNDFEIWSLYVADNGFESNDHWADGLVSHRCDSGSIHDSWFINNTDVALGVGHGACIVTFNTIRQTSRYAFAGMVIGSNFSHAGSQYKYNTIESGYNLMTFGLSVGSHAWKPSEWIQDVGEVMGNSITGAVINLAVDGVLAGTVTGNSFSNPQGNKAMNGCPSYPAANYTIGHFGATIVQAGWDAQRTYDNGTCP